MRKASYRITEAFPEPNYTQTPNDFFSMLPDMESSEVRVTLVMIRETFGYHRETFKMGLGKLAEAAGLSRNAAKDGAEFAEKRGTFKRTNPDSLGEAEWELVIGQPVTTPQPVTGDGQPVTTTHATSDSQVGVKERKKEKKGDIFDGMLYYQQQAESQGVNEIEELAVKLDSGLRLNFPRGLKDQQVYKRILKSGVSVDRFIEWVKSDEKRLSFAFLYAKDTETIWRDLPQVTNNNNNNPQGLEVGI